jgi:hypothetical protein
MGEIQLIRHYTNKIENLKIAIEDFDYTLKALQDFISKNELSADQYFKAADLEIELLQDKILCLEEREKYIRRRKRYVTDRMLIYMRYSGLSFHFYCSFKNSIDSMSK